MKGENKGDERMIQQNSLRIKFKRGKEEISSHSGLVVVGKILRKIISPVWLKERLSYRGSNRGYWGEEIVEPLILMLCGGGNRLEDIRVMREDRLLRKVMGWRRVPSADTVGRWLRKAGREGGDKILEKVNEKVSRQVLKNDGKSSYTLDIDATVIESEKKEAKMTYKGEKGYTPLLGFLSENGVCIKGDFREGNRAPHEENKEFVEECLKSIPEEIKIKRLRSDSAGYQAKVINLCLDKGITFYIGAEQDKAVKEAIKSIPERCWRVFRDKEGNLTDRQYAETIHCMEKSKEAFRLVVLRWEKKQLELFDKEKYEYFAIATNSEEEAEKVIHIYQERGKAENFIKELKNDMGLDWIPTGDFLANRIYFLLGIISYNLLVLLRRVFLGGEWIRKRISTIRWHFIEVAGKLIYHARSFVIKLWSINKEIFLLFEKSTQMLPLLDTS